jgi:hypothetical protein
VVPYLAKPCNYLLSLKNFRDDPRNKIGHLSIDEVPGDEGEAQGTIPIIILKEFILIINNLLPLTSARGFL